MAPFLISLAVMGLLGGLAGWLLLPRTVTGEARLVVGEQSIKAQSVPAYAVATQQLADTFARLISADAVRSHIGPGIRDVQATAIPSSAIIRVQASADDPTAAAEGANVAADALIEVARRAQGDGSTADLGRQYVQARKSLQEAQEREDRASQGDQASAEEVQSLQGEVALAQLQVDALAQAYQQSISSLAGGVVGVTRVQDGVPVTSTAPRAVVIGVLGGMFCAGALWSLATLLRRPRSES